MKKLRWLYDWIQKKNIDALIPTQFKIAFLQGLPFWVASLAVGLLSVIYASLFNSAESVLKFIFHWNRWSLFFVTPASFVLAWWVVHRFAPNARGSGIPQVMAAIELTDRKDTWGGDQAFKP